MLIGVHTIPLLLAALLFLVSAWSWKELKSEYGSNRIPPASAARDSSKPEPASYEIEKDLRGEGPALGISPVFMPSVTHWSEDIIRWSQEQNLDPNLVAVVMQVESCGHPKVRSAAGAQGLFQVMPFHFSRDEDPLNPETNAARGLAYLAASLRIAQDDPSNALAGYNGGHGIIGKEPREWPPETQRYVRWTAGILDEIESGLVKSKTLDEWLAAGGSSLCRRAAQALDLPDLDPG